MFPEKKQVHINLLLYQSLCVEINYQKDELTNLPYVDKAKINKIFGTSELGFPNPPKIGVKNINIAGCVRWAGSFC